MMRSLFHLAIIGLALLPFTAAQSSLASALDELPSCAISCLVTAIASSTCSPTNQTCMCTNESLQNEVTLCVTESCTIREALLTKNVTVTSCGSPVHDRSGLYNNISISLGVISGLFVAVRIVFKVFVSGADLGLDDWFIMLTLVSGIPSSVINVHGLTANGLGKDVWTLDYDMITRFVEFFYVMEILYFLQVALLKMSILFFYLKIFPGIIIRRIMWGTVAFNLVFGLLFIFLAIFQCSPISFYWDRWDGEHEGTCLNINGLGWSNAGLSIALDAWMLAIPMFQLQKLKLHWKKKIGVAMMFCVGTFVTVVSIMRLQSLVSFANSLNPTWDNFDVANWSTIEINVGIICACMPALRVVLVHFFPRVMGSTHRATSYRNKYYVSGGNRSRSQTGGVSADAKEGSAPPSGIVYSKSFNVDYGENDEISLVRVGNGRDGDGRGSQGTVPSVEGQRSGWSGGV